MSRPVVSVFDPESSTKAVSTVTLPAVFTAPIRSDVVHYVHTLMAKNKRQPYAVSLIAGHQVQKTALQRINYSSLSFSHALNCFFYLLLYICFKVDPCRVMGYWPCSFSYSPRARRRYLPRRTGCLRQHVPWRSHVRTHEDLAPLAQEDQREPAQIRRLLGAGRLRAARAGDGARSPR